MRLIGYPTLRLVCNELFLFVLSTLAISISIYVKIVCPQKRAVSVISSPLSLSKLRFWGVSCLKQPPGPQPFLHPSHRATSMMPANTERWVVLHWMNPGSCQGPRLKNKMQPTDPTLLWSKLSEQSGNSLVHVSPCYQCTVDCGIRKRVECKIWGPKKVECWVGNVVVECDMQSVKRSVKWRVGSVRCQV